MGLQKNHALPSVCEVLARTREGQINLGGLVQAMRPSAFTHVAVRFTNAGIRGKSGGMHACLVLGVTVCQTASSWRRMRSSALANRLSSRLRSLVSIYNQSKHCTRFLPPTRAQACAPLTDHGLPDACQTENITPRAI
jgi:hypothetical protein